MTKSPEQGDILAALSKVQEPELHNDLVSLNMIRDLSIAEGTISFTVVLTTPACPLRGQIEKEARQAVMAVPGFRRYRSNGTPTSRTMAACAAW
jgi:ATP-binding protein involved in chromosome partitioning